MIESNYSKTIIKLKESILNSSANLSFLELKNMKSFTDLKTSNILKEIEFQKFKGIIKSKKDETMYLKSFTFKIFLQKIYIAERKMIHLYIFF